jgi:hypothetical protein
VAIEAVGFDEATRAGNHTNKCALSNDTTTMTGMKTTVVHRIS